MELQRVTCCMTQIYNENGVPRIDIYNGDNNMRSVQVTKDLTLDKGQYYTLIFYTNIESALTVQAVRGMELTSYTAYSQYKQIELKSDMTEYSFNFIMYHSTD